MSTCVNLLGTAVPVALHSNKRGQRVGITDSTLHLLHAHQALHLRPDAPGLGVVGVVLVVVVEDGSTVSVIDMYICNTGMRRMFVSHRRQYDIRALTHDPM